MSTATALSLSIDTVGQLGLHLSPRTSGLLLAAPRGLALGAALALEVAVGAPLPRRFQLEGRVAQLDPPAAFVAPADQQVIRAELARESWKRLFVYVCRTPWRRRADLEPRPGDDRRWRLQEPALCYVPRTGQRYDATLLEVSERGAFLGIDAATVETGEEVRFRGRHDMAWHSARVRWRGVKERRAGVGVEIDFVQPEDRSRWVSWLSFAERRGQVAAHDA